MFKPVIEMVGTKHASLTLLSAFLGMLAFDLGKDLVPMTTREALQILVTGYALLFLGAGPFMLIGQGSWGADGGWRTLCLFIFPSPPLFSVGFNLWRHPSGFD